MTVHRVPRAEVVEIDGASHSGSGTIVRQCVAYAALTARPVRVVNVRARRRKPGLAHQHLRAVEAVRDLVGGRLEGAWLGSREFSFAPEGRIPRGRYEWAIGSAGSTTALALALLPVLAVGPAAVEIELRGGLFQDFAPSVFHLQHVLAPLLHRMGMPVEVAMVRPGYVPHGEGVLRVRVDACSGPLQPLVIERAGAVERVWGIALSSHLAERRVSARMAGAARRTLTEAGHPAAIDEEEDVSAVQPGAALALFADLDGAVRLGADGAGAPGRRAEGIGTRAARQLADEIASGATVDRFVADQIVPFAALAEGETRVRIARPSEHLDTAAWLARTFLGAQIRVDDGALTVRGVGLRRIGSVPRRAGR